MALGITPPQQSETCAPKSTRMDLDGLEALLRAPEAQYMSCDASDAHFHCQDILLRVEEHNLPPGAERAFAGEQEALNALGGIEWHGRQVVVSYAGLPVADFMAVDIHSLDEEFGATIPVPIVGEICPLAWDIARSISSHKWFDGFTVDLGWKPNSRITSWHPWPRRSHS